MDGGEVTLSSDAQERLHRADVEAGGLLAATHVHRYELAARLCAGRRVLDLCCGTGYGSWMLARTAASVHGVDIAPEAVEAARAYDGGGTGVRPTFESEDALTYLRAIAAGEFDAVVCFEGLEHVPDPDAVLAELVRLADAGTGLILSLPNSRGFDEDNEFHRTDYGYEEMLAVSERLPAAIVLPQYHAEASLIGRGDASTMRELRGRLLGSAGDEAWANHWLILTGVEAGETDAAEAALTLTVEANHNQYMRSLEHANAELYEANVRMGRERLGVHDAAAASVEAHRASLAGELAQLKRELETTRAEAWGYEAALKAPRYRAVDAARGLAFKLPGVATVLRARRRLIQRRGSRSR